MNSNDTTRQTALHYACSGGSLECVKLLLDAGSDIAEKDRNGETPLFKASLRGHLDILKLLLEKSEKRQANGAKKPAITTQRLAGPEWETLTLLLEEKIEAAKDKRINELIRERNNLRKDSSPIRDDVSSKKTLDVLIISAKHAQRRSIFQLLSIDGSVKSSYLMLEKNTEHETEHESLSSSSSSSVALNEREKTKEKDKDKKKKKSVKIKKKEKDSKKGKEKTPRDSQLDVIVKGYLEILCLLIERGDLKSSLRNMAQSTLLFDLVDKTTFQTLFSQLSSFMTNNQNEHTENGIGSHKDLIRRQRSVTFHRENSHFSVSLSTFCAALYMKTM